MFFGAIAGSYRAANCPAGGYDNINNWPSTANRPTFVSGTNTLSWIGPSGGGASTTSDVQQSLVLTNSGSINTSSNGQLIEGKNISGTIVVNHTNVTVRRCRVFSSSALFLIETENAQAADTTVIEDCLIESGTGQGASGSAAVTGGATIRRCNINGLENGPYLANGSFVIDNLIHSMDAAGGDPHVDGIQNLAGSDVIIEHNHIEAWDTSNIFNNSAFGPIDNVVINRNRLIKDPGRSAPSYAIYADETNNSLTNVQITNNIIQVGFYGNYCSLDAGTVSAWSNNRDYLDDHLINQGD